MNTCASPRHISGVAFPALSSLSPFPPNPPLPKPPLLTARHHQNHRRFHPLNISRRDAAAAALLSFLALIAHPAPSSAFSIGISGPKDWLKEQKRKSSKFLLAPIDASREILRSAFNLLTGNEFDYTNKELEEMQEMLKSAARDCVPQERNAFVAFQANTGVEVCTFKLIVKNAASLLDKKDPVKLEAEAMLDDLIRSFAYLNGLANGTDIQLASGRQKVADALMDTISSLNKFEQGVKECLEV